jgi:L-threonylcarbamoyladenylate synthase
MLTERQSLKVNNMKIMTECNLSQIVSEILNGQVLVFPTETSYGLGCDATNQTVVDKIFKIKGRVDDKPLLVVVDSIETAKKYLVWNDVLEKLAQKYWPGPLTIVGEYAGDNLAAGVVGKDNTVAVRVSDFPLLKSITEKIGRPLVATSANLAGQENIYDSQKIIDIFASQKYQPDIILNYGQLPINQPTTLVSVVDDNLKILRQGKIIL